MPETTPDGAAAPTGEELLDALRAVHEAISIPNGATARDQEIRDRILIERAGHAAVMIDSILSGKCWCVAWDLQYLRLIMERFPATGYKTWDERVGELEAERQASPPDVRGESR